MNSRISVLTCIILAMLIVSMDTTIMNTTMPIIAKELGNMRLYPWIFSGYMIFSTVLVPVSGRLSDLYGRKKVFACGIVLFLFGSMLCGLSQSMLQLVLFRIVQGIGAGVVMPFPNIIAGDLFSVEQRGKIQALLTGMWGLAAVLAPLLGSLLVQYATWGWIFYINIPICIIAFVLLLPYREEYHPKKAEVDFIGAMLFAGGIGLLLAPTIDSRMMGYALGGALLLLLFFLYERKQKSPLIPLPLIKKPTLAWMSINGFVGWAALFGSSSYIPMFLQQKGFSIFMSGVALLGLALGWIAMSVPSGKLILRFGYRRLLIFGNLLLVISGAMLIVLNISTSYLYVLFAMIVQGLAFGLIGTVQIIGSQQLVSPHEKGISTSLQMMSRNIGTAVGVAIMGALLVQATEFYAGIHHLFLYGFIAACFSFGSSLFIKEEAKVLAFGA